MSMDLRKVALLLCFSLTLARTFPSAAILPFSGLLGTKEDERSAQQQQQQQQHRQNPAGVSVPPLPPQRGNPRKPPPPPPPPRGATAQVRPKEGAQPSSQSNTRVNNDETKNNNPDYPQHPPQFWAPGPFDHYGGLPPPPPGWMGPPPEWQQPESDWHLDEFLAREKDLISELQNLTGILSSYEQREDLHMRQLDVLTERVMDVEAASAMERNELVEYRHNCTELGRTVALQNDEIEEWTQRCNNLTAQHEQDEERMKEIKAELKRRSREVEEFASAIETARLDAERNKYLAERKKKQKKRGFLYWIFGIGSAEEREEDRLQEAQEHARATLLRALQTERDSVEELENVVSTLQQNNSAIAEMVESRDMLIDELNNRVAVFEEDKLVLKAALRQLQKEMKEEAPKTQKLFDDLKEAREEVQRMTAEVNSIISDHQTEVKLLQNVISQKQSAINATESNMTVIGTYVDKLEERLAMFALARRDIAIREEKCKEIEERVIALEQECEELRKEAEQYESEHTDLKSLLEDLVVERTSLQKEVAKLTKENDGLLAEGQTLRDTIASLEIDVDSLGKAMADWQSRTSELESTVEGQSSELLEKGARENELTDILQETLSKMKEMEEEASRAAQASEVAIAEAKEELRVQEEKLRMEEEKHKAVAVYQEPPVFARPSIPPPPPPPGGEQIVDQSLLNKIGGSPHVSSSDESVKEEMPSDPDMSSTEHSTPTFKMEEQEMQLESLTEHSTPAFEEEEQEMQLEHASLESIDNGKVLPSGMSGGAENLSPQAELPVFDEMRLEDPVEDDSHDEEIPENTAAHHDIDADMDLSPEDVEISLENGVDDAVEQNTSDDEIRLEEPVPEPLEILIADEEEPAPEPLETLHADQAESGDEEEIDESTDSESETEEMVDEPALPEATEQPVSNNEGKPSPPGRPQDPARVPPPSMEGSPPPGERRPPPRPNKIPFRAIRKAFSHRTGIHGLITRPSRFYPTREQKRQAKLNAKQREKQAKLLAKQEQPQKK